MNSQRLNKSKFMLAVAMLIAFWIWDEVTYDKSFTHHQQLAQVMTTFISDDGSSGTAPNVCQPLAGELRGKYEKMPPTGQ